MPRRTNDMPKRIITELSDEQEAMLPCLEHQLTADLDKLEPRCTA